MRHPYRIIRTDPLSNGQWSNLPALEYSLLRMPVGETILIDMDASDHLRAWTRPKGFIDRSMMHRKASTPDDAMMMIREYTLPRSDGSTFASITRTSGTWGTCGTWLVEMAHSLPDTIPDGTYDPEAIRARAPLPMAGCIAWSAPEVTREPLQGNARPAIGVYKGSPELAWMIEYPTHAQLMHVAHELETHGQYSAWIECAKYRGEFTATGLRWLAHNMHRHGAHDLRYLRHVVAFDVDQDHALHGYHAQFNRTEVGLNR